MKTYVDSIFHCHTTNPNGIFREFYDPFFDGKCSEFAEGYCYDDSKGYADIYPWKPYAELERAQIAYERQQLADYKAACAEMGIVV